MLEATASLGDPVPLGGKMRRNGTSSSQLKVRPGEGEGASSAGGGASFSCGSMGCVLSTVSRLP